MERGNRSYSASWDEDDLVLSPLLDEREGVMELLLDMCHGKRGVKGLGRFVHSLN